MPKDPEVNVDGKLWKTNEDLKGLTSLNTLFLTFFVALNDFTPDTLIQELLGYTFMSCSLVENVVVELPSEGKYNGGKAHIYCVTLGLILVRSNKWSYVLIVILQISRRPPSVGRLL